MTSSAQQGPSEEKRTAAETPLRALPAFAGTPTGSLIVRHFAMHLPGDRRSLFLSRVWTRRMATVLCWSGDVQRAVEVVARLVDNGVRHGIPSNVPAVEVQLTLTLATDEAGALVIDVADLNPAFPDFDAAVRGERGRGLQRVTFLGARVSRFLPHEGRGKTVRAVLPPGPVDV
ncbi:ATP-binding protein [Streptomyces rochei]|uniref:ATP-binding protein n=1 Tax=Streptomyces rochei TaxID=1928 RepID=UPI0037879B8C